MNPRPRAEKVLRNIGQLLTMDPAAGGPGDTARDPTAGLGLILDAAVAMAGDRIVWVGREKDLKGQVDTEGATVEDMGGRVVLPGLVECHTHTLFAGSRAQEFARRVGGASYEEILAAGGGIHSTVIATRQATLDTLVALGKERLDTFLSFGVTTVEIKSGYGLNLDDELKLLRAAAELAQQHAVDVVPTCLGAHVVPAEHKKQRQAYIDMLCEELLPAVAEEGLARFCDVFVDSGAFSVKEAETILRRGLDLGLKPKMHAEQITRTGAIDLALELGAVSVDHLEKVTEEDARALADSNTVAVLLPGATYFLGRTDFAPGRMLADAGCKLAISTDFNPGSCHTENLPLMLNMACLYNGIYPREALLGATRWAATALDLDNEIGSLTPGRLADLLVLNTRDFRNLIYHFGVPMTHQVYKRGKTVWSREVK